MSIITQRPLPKCPVPNRLALEIGEAIGSADKMQRDWVALVRAWKRQVLPR